MALENYRITEFQEKTQVDSGDYVLIDSATDGTHKYQLSRIPAQASAEVDAAVAAEKTAREAADAAEVTARNAAISAAISDEVAARNAAISANVDDTLAVSGKAADAKKTGDEIADVKSDLTEIEEEISHITGLSDEAKEALLACFEHVAWVDDDGQDYYDALEAALSTTSASLSAVFTQGSDKFYPFDSLDSLKSNLVVTYIDGEGQSSVVTNYTLSGTLTVGTAVITATYNGTSAQFNVTVESVAMTNNAAIALENGASLPKHYAMNNSPITARCRFDLPIKNRSYTIAVVDSAKYNVAGYDLSSNVLEEFSYGGTTYQGYPMSTNNTPSWSTSWTVTGTYIWCAFKKMDGTNFTTEEITNAYGTIFIVYSSDNVISWSGHDTVSIPQKWADKNAICKLVDPSKLVLANGYSIGGGTVDDAAYPKEVANRATSLSQAIVGNNFDGKTIGLSSFQLTSGASVSYGFWYGYVDDNNAYKGSQYISAGTDNMFVFGKWLTENVILPTDNSKSGERVILMAFRVSTEARDFTPAELKEIPTLIQIT